MDSYTERTIATYDRMAAELADLYASAPPRNEREVHGTCLPLPGGDILDIGAGGGTSAQRFIDLGYRVTAVEPSAGMRGAGKKNAPEADWIDDRLPDLPAITAIGRQWSFIQCKAVFMHVPPADRAKALDRFYRLLTPGGYVALLYRHGPPPEDRPMFPADPDELNRLAGQAGFHITRTSIGRKDVFGRDGVHFSWHWWQRPQ